MTNEHEILKKIIEKKTVDLKTYANFKRRSMKYSNNLEVDVVYQLWAAILKNSQYCTHLYNLALICLDLLALKLSIGQTKQTGIWVLARRNT